MQKILVDSSIWILFFKGDSRVKEMIYLLEKNRVVINDVILTELLPFIVFAKKEKEKELLSNLSKVSLKIDWNNLRLQQYENKLQGVNGVGIPDLIIYEQVIQQKLLLWTDDKHFLLMNKNNSIDLFTP